MNLTFVMPPTLQPSRSGFSGHLAGNQLQDCFEFWRAQRVDGRPPLKRQLDPAVMPRKILPSLFIYELLGDRFRCRLAGTKIVDVFKEDPTGRYLDELLSPGAAENRLHLFMGVVGRVLPVVYGGKLAAGPNTWMSFKRLLLPVSKTGAAVDIVFGMAIFPEFGRRANHRDRHAEPDSDFVAWAHPQDLTD